MKSIFSILAQILMAPAEQVLLMMIYIGITHNFYQYFFGSAEWEFEWQWFALMISISGISISLLNIGKIIAIRKYSRGLLRTYFDCSQFECHEQAIDVAKLPKIIIYTVEDPWKAAARMTGLLCSK